MKKPVNKRKIIVIAAAAILAVLVVIGVIFGIRAIVKKNQSADTGGVKKATSSTLKEFKEEAEKLEKASETFFTLEQYEKYDYPTGLVITVEVNDYGKLVVLGSQFNTNALEDLITYSGINVGADIGLTDVVYSIRFERNNIIETTEGSADDPDTILKTEVETTVEKTKIAPVDDTAYKGYADKVLALLKSYVSSHNLTLTDSKIYINSDDDGNLKMYNYCIGMTQEQADEFASEVSSTVPLNEFVGGSGYGYEIDINNNTYKMVKFNIGE